MLTRDGDRNISYSFAASDILNSDSGSGSDLGSKGGVVGGVGGDGVWGRGSGLR